MVPRLKLASKLAVPIFLLLVATHASAVPIAVANPGGTTTEIGARIRWGASGFEASLFDNSPLNQNPTLNPVGSPVWGVGNAYKFKITFDSVTGALDLSVDFNRDSSFGAGEYISRSVFTAPPQTNYTGYAFDYLSISGNESGSTGRSMVSNLVINGTSLATLTPAGLFLEQFYEDSSGNPMAAITITGDLTFMTAGTSQERPSWNFNFKNSALAPTIPEPGAVGVFSIGLLVAGGLIGRSRRS